MAEDGAGPRRRFPGSGSGRREMGGGGTVARLAGPELAPRGARREGRL